MGGGRAGTVLYKWHEVKKPQDGAYTVWDKFFHSPIQLCPGLEPRTESGPGFPILARRLRGRGHIVAQAYAPWEKGAYAIGGWLSRDPWKD